MLLTCCQAFNLGTTAKYRCKLDLELINIQESGMSADSAQACFDRISQPVPGGAKLFRGVSNDIFPLDFTTCSLLLSHFRSFKYLTA
jgi:hypothetical protein